ncbi:MAG: MBL fold metallo-hydrolase [Christensenellaceae bacterium]|jgi:phosphoribosyl 1,2-cyclic phosphodiesterase|nr:MBL fold metallo-hydrolase [Christensenellaceae bacterium]
MLLCPLCSGSSGNATLAEIGGARILIDAGKPCRTIEGALAAAGIPPQTITALVITHEHSDHVMGAGIFSRKYDVPIYANAGTWEGMQPQIGEVAPRNTRVIATGRDFYLKDVNVTPFKTPHDSNESVGYAFCANGHKISVMTDIGHAGPELLAYVEHSDLLLIEANHDPELVKSCAYPYVTKRRILSSTGHLSNEDAGLALAQLYMHGVRQAILGHLSRDNNFEELALSTVRAQLRAADIPDAAFALAVAHRDRLTGRFEIAE